MHPYLAADLAAAHRADLLRDAAARCCTRVARHPLLGRIRTAVRRWAAGPACCPA